jgi:hypothetical protein
MGGGDIRDSIVPSELVSEFSARRGSNEMVCARLREVKGSRLPEGDLFDATFNGQACFRRVG